MTVIKAGKYTPSTLAKVIGLTRQAITWQLRKKKKPLIDHAERVGNCWIITFDEDTDFKTKGNE